MMSPKNWLKKIVIIIVGSVIAAYESHLPCMRDSEAQLLQFCGRAFQKHFI